ncbi:MULTISPECIES: hypothetical protein [Acinetobacter calcoaceticus/baumannii complex]|uniref:hypothetical protein n=1 Tax=Acinetobacter TaxID=469 RepID=UPI00057F2ED6|nr:MULTISPECIES: hypothetical protein [Acinetobacter calcoaceticus/baumannii complex]AJB48761.1 hypothetical protein RR32_11760 [Acinetobacter nosocomialis]MBR7739090.1 hypothetical protein [Acinetobacter nosocomialis]MCH2000542.1 hypothetical protein [Acinetobacter seifertii]MDO7436913.1 hypothetical protein [Acinetobacter nosocomialis]QNX32613.1 hypothetical protein IC788_11680 [Acinetobacter seifertii]
MDLIKDIEGFCRKYEIDFLIMSLDLTDEINEFMSPLWQGTTGEMNWEITNTEFLKLSFPNEIDNTVINKIVSNLKFKLLNEESVYLYFSGFEAVIKINTNKFFLNLFNFMDEFCFLDFIYFLSIDSSKKDIKLVELRIFEYICGNL